MPAYRLIQAALQAVAAVVPDVVEARQHDSPGGRRITPDEVRDIAEAYLDALRPRLIEALGQL